MASAYWRTNHTVASLLNEREAGWEFLQLVKTLLLMANTTALDNDDALLNTLNQTLAFKGSLASDFPPGDIRGIEQRWDQEGNPQPTMITLVNGVLSTTDGPLPEPFVSWIKDLASRGDHAMADFLDIFNNRLMALRYLVCRTTRPNLMDVSSDDSHTGAVLQALSGTRFNRSPHHPAAKRTDIALSGLLANSRMSLPVIKQLLHFEMGLPLQSLNACQGGWLRVDQQDHSQLSKATCRLGTSATLGTKIWDQQQAITLTIGPLSWSTVSALIPGGDNHQRFFALLNRITDCRCDCHVVLLLPTQQVPRLSLMSTQKNAEKRSTMTESDSQKNNTPVALGLTTRLSSLTSTPVTEPVTSNRSKDEPEMMKIRFTVETSNPSLAIDNDVSFTAGGVA